MPKRVHELAKELNMSSKELLNCIERLGIENKKPVSNLNDDETKKVRNFLDGAGKTNTDKPKPQAPAQQQSQGQGDRPNYQNRNQSQNQGDRPNYQNRNQGQSQGDRPNYQNRNQGQSQGDRPNYQNRNQGQQGDRPNYQNRNQGQSQGDRPNYQNRNQGQQGDRPNYQNRNQGQQGDRPNYQNRNQGQQGDRPNYQNRNQGQQGDRPNYQNRNQGQGQQGDRPNYQNRSQSDRPNYQNRSQGQQGDRPNYQNRSQGDRPNYQNRSQGQQGDRPNYQNRNQGQGQQGDRPNYQNRSQGDRPNYQNRGQGQGGQSAFNRQKQQFDQKPSGKQLEQQTKPTNTRYEQNKQIKNNKIKQGFEKPDAAPKKVGPQVKKMTKKDRKQQKQLVKAQKEQQAIEEAKLRENDIKTIQIGKNISVKELAEKLGRNTSEIIMPLMKLGIMATINQEIDYYTASNIAESFDVIVEEADEIDILEQAFATEDDKDEDKTERPPVVVVMGHVDHGKTSLLDKIRQSKVTAGEAGGITQHIGAYTVSINDKPITFLDTPGHEAFTAMRMRGAQVTDIAILVVAADDGVMPQTIEAINHAKAANVEIIVAINKMDKPSANPDRVKQELVEHGIQTEDWGGSTICVPVSAIKGDGIDELLEMILLAAEMRELRANADKHARGTVIEAQLDKGRGPVATILVQEGTLNVGDPVVAGRTYGKIRAMVDDKGNKVKTAGPSIPVEILGLSEVPNAGDMFYVADNERHARQVAESVLAQTREDLIKATPQKVSLDDLFNQIQSGNVKELNIVIKADVQGSVEAVKNSLERLSNSEVRIRTIHGGVGAITESDVMLASASNAIIIGFNVRPENSARSVADEEKVDMRLYRIIYNAIEDITAAMKGMLDPIFEEKIIGHAEIRQIFKASGVGTIGGAYITDGKFQRNASVRIVRDGIVVYDGEMAALRRFKDDVKEVNAGYECGITFNNYNDIKEGDKVEAYVMEEIKR